MRVSFVEQRLSDDAESQPRILVGPVTFTTRDVVEPGYVLGYEMLFRNLSAECGCIPKCPASLGSVANRLTDALNPVSARHHIAVSPVPRSLVRPWLAGMLFADPTSVGRRSLRPPLALVSAVAEASHRI